MGNVIALRAFVAHAAVSVEMVMLSIQANLVFGPFESKDEALRFARKLEGAHGRRKMPNTLKSAEVFLETGLPAMPYEDVCLSKCIVAEHPLARKEAQGLIPPGIPEETEKKLADYAIRAANEATGYACHLLDHPHK